MTRPCLDKPKPGQPLLSRPCPWCVDKTGFAWGPIADCHNCYDPATKTCRGWLPVDLPWGECERCYGSGVTRQSIYAQCPHCSGRGRVLRWPTEIFQLAEAMHRAAGEVVECGTCSGCGTPWRHALGEGSLDHSLDCMCGHNDCPGIPGFKQGDLCSACSGTGTVPAEQPYYALHAALLEEGFPELAEHFGEVPCPTHCQKISGMYKVYEHAGPDSHWVICPKCHGSTGTYPLPHPPGCWALNLILNKE